MSGPMSRPLRCSEAVWVKRVSGNVQHGNILAQCREPKRARSYIHLQLSVGIHSTCHSIPHYRISFIDIQICSGWMVTLVTESLHSSVVPGYSEEWRGHWPFCHTHGPEQLFCERFSSMDARFTFHFIIMKFFIQFM